MSPHGQGGQVEVALPQGLDHALAQRSTLEPNSPTRVTLAAQLVWWVQLVVKHPDLLSCLLECITDSKE